MQGNTPAQTEVCRRAFLGHGASVLGGAALSSLLSSQQLPGAAADAVRPGLVRPLHFPAKAAGDLPLHGGGTVASGDL